MYTNHGSGHLQGGPQCQGTWDFQGKIFPYGLIFPGGGPEANRQNILICEIWAVDKQVCSIVSCLKMFLNKKKKLLILGRKIKTILLYQVPLNNATLLPRHKSLVAASVFAFLIHAISRVHILLAFLFNIYHFFTCSKGRNWTWNSSPAGVRGAGGGSMATMSH